MSPIRLTDEELTHIFEAARPIPVERRDDFLRAVANALHLDCSGEIGPGDVHRAIVRAQKAHFDYPDLSDHSGGRWHRSTPRYEQILKQTSGGGLN